MTILLAGIGNLLLGDDGFGCAVARRLASMPLPEDVRVEDFGARGFDLALALAGDIEAAVLVDAMPRGGAPGTLYVLEPDVALAAERGLAGGHGLDPVGAIALAAQLAGRAPVLRVIGCEPGEPDDMALSPAVRAAVGPAAELALSVAASLRAEARRAEPRCSSADHSRVGVVVDARGPADMAPGVADIPPPAGSEP